MVSAMDDFNRLIDQFADTIARRVVEIQHAEAAKKAKLYLTPAQMAERTGVTVKTLANLRSKKSGPRFVKVGGAVRYPVEAERSP